MAPPNQSPPVFVDEDPVLQPVIPARTNVTAFVGDVGADLAGQVIEIRSFLEFANLAVDIPANSVLKLSVKLFFENGGRIALISSSLDVLRDHMFNLLCIPVGDSEPAVSLDEHQAAASLCENKRAFYIADPPSTWFALGDAVESALRESTAFLRGNANAALYFPRLRVRPSNRMKPATIPPSGAVAGVMARTDETRGVWNAPAGLDAGLRGIAGFDIDLSDGQNGLLNPEGVNSLRKLPGAGPVVWGARTRAGADGLGSDWKYIPVRRLALFIESSLADSLGWVAFEPNGEPLWARITLSVTSFLNDLFRQGAFQGASAKEAYFVKCDAATTTSSDIESGIVNMQIGFAPLKPAEFIVLHIKTRTAVE
jgi:uncharacterized protein